MPDNKIDDEALKTIFTIPDCVASCCYTGKENAGTTILPHPPPTLMPTPNDMTNKITDKDNWKHRADSMRCSTCVFYVRKERLTPMQVGQPWPGRCRRNAPTMKGWPVVFDTDWCGDHKLDEERA